MSVDSRLAVPGGYAIHGHAIVSADDIITDAAGRTPRTLRNSADWRRFQAALDAAAVTVLGRRGHELHGNASGRPRIVVTGSVAGLEAQAETVFWNPAGADLAEALTVAVPGGGTVAVVGGRRVFDLFLLAGYDEFHLARAEEVTIGEGERLFSSLGPQTRAEDALVSAGLRPTKTKMLDPAAGVTITVFRK